MLQRYTAAAVTPFSLVTPVVGLASTYLLLGETLSTLELAGALLILVGLAVAVIRLSSPRALTRAAVRIRATRS